MATAARLAEEHSVIDAEVVEDDAAPGITFDEKTDDMDQERPASVTSEEEE